MTRTTLLLIGTIILLAPTLSHAQSPIAPSRRIDWSQVGIPGGIPNRTTICATLNPGATVAQINSAIAACPSGQVVLLTAGTYNLSSGIDFSNKSNITLRGAGPDQTKLVFAASVSCFGLGGDICVRNNELNYTGQPLHTTNWTGGYAKGATQITLASTAGLAVGSIIILDQLNDSDSDTGSIWVCYTANICAVEGSGGGGRDNRAQEQLVKVTAIAGNTVTIAPALYMPNWRASQNPQAWFGDTVIRGVGIEGLSLDHGSSDALSGIFFFNASNCWVKNVRSVNSNRNHVWFWQTSASVVRDSYFYGTRNSAPQSYGVESYMSADNLVENNIFQHITSPVMINGATTGSVFSYNYTFDMPFSPAPDVMFPGQLSHGAGVDMVLHEGNEGDGIWEDHIHGTHHFVTMFRNYLNGFEPGKTGATIPINIKGYGRYSNVVGNVLGKAGYHNSYEWSVLGPNENTSIFALGAGNGPPNDPLVRSTLMRWGNYDTVSGTVRWNADEVPSGLSQYANPVPGNNSLPASLYLSAKPAWWASTIPWPPIGPDVNGGSGPGGHAYKIPARVCYESSSSTNGILNFNADWCYGGGGSTTVLPPTNLRIVQ